MKRVHCIVEGQTEMSVFSSILKPYIYKKTNTYIEFTDISHSREGKKGRGGIVKYPRLLKELRCHLQDKGKILTTFFDYYGINESYQFPNYKEAKVDQTNPKVGVDLLEKGIKKDIESKNINARNFIPYIQLHEFEALLFSSNDGFDSQYNNENILEELKKIVLPYETPEDINDSPKTAPSKRIISILRKHKENYAKVNDGTAIAKEVGIETMLKKCPRFRNWVNKLVDKINN